VRATASRPRWVCERAEEPRSGRSRCAGALAVHSHFRKENDFIRRQWTLKSLVRSITSNPLREDLVFETVPDYGGSMAEVDGERW